MLVDQFLHFTHLACFPVATNRGTKIYIDVDIDIPLVWLSHWRRCVISRYEIRDARIFIYTKCSAPRSVDVTSS